MLLFACNKTLLSLSKSSKNILATKFCFIFSLVLNYLKYISNQQSSYSQTLQKNEKDKKIIS